MKFQLFILALALFQVALGEESQSLDPKETGDATPKSIENKSAEKSAEGSSDKSAEKPDTSGEKPVGGNGWVDKFAEKTKQVVHKTSQIYKDTAGLWGDGIQKTTEIGKKVSDFNTEMGKKAVVGVTNIVGQALEGSAGLMTQGNELGKQVVGLLPGRWGKGLQSALDFFNKEIAKGKDKAIEAMDKLSSGGQKAMDMANSKATSVADKVNEMAQTGVKKVQDTVSQVEGKLVGDGTVAGLTSYKLKGLHGEAQ